MTKPCNLNLAIEGYFKFEAVRPDGTRRTLADWQKNLILDSGLDRLGSGGVWDRCQVGTGTAAPSVGQTTLASFLANSSSSMGNLAGTDTPTNTYAWARKTFRFNAGVATGNLTEVGIGWSAGGGGLFSRALIKDEGGAPTTITVLSDEYLDVTYEVRVYPEMSDRTFSNVDISGTDYSFTVRPAVFSGSETSVGAWPNRLTGILGGGFTSVGSVNFGLTAYQNGVTLGAITGTPSGSQAASNSNATYAFRSAYASNSYKRECRATWGLTAGTVAFGGFLLQSATGTYQMIVSPNIPKDNTKILTLDFDLSWARGA